LTDALSLDTSHHHPDDDHSYKHIYQKHALAVVKMIKLTSTN
jgi:hypothetical protein